MRCRLDALMIEKLIGIYVEINICRTRMSFLARVETYFVHL